jgi:hypothetical protein
MLNNPYIIDGKLEGENRPSGIVLIVFTSKSLPIMTLGIM